MVVVPSDTVKFPLLQLPVQFDSELAELAALAGFAIAAAPSRAARIATLRIIDFFHMVFFLNWLGKLKDLFFLEFSDPSHSEG